jgi:hypothetical protein
LKLYTIILRFIFVVLILGKTLQTIALLHCLLTHPALVDTHSQGTESALCNHRLIHRVLAIVPVNVLVNWEQEIEKWVDRRAVPKIRTYNLNNMQKKFEADRDNEIKNTWIANGGILFASPDTLRSYLNSSLEKENVSSFRYSAFFSPGPDGRTFFIIFHSIKHYLFLIVVFFLFMKL